MVRRAVVAGALASPLAYVGGALAGGGAGGASALLAVIVVTANFAAHGVSLAWASRVSIAALQGVALGGFVLRMAVMVAALFVLDRTAFFSPTIFGVTVVVATLALLGYEARLVAAGLGGAVQVPPDLAAAEAAERLRAREEAL